MRIFKKKEKIEHHDVNGEILKALDMQLDLIKFLRKDIKALMLNDSEISKIVSNQQQAINDLQKQVNELQKLINNEEIL